jgi:hypothetical protein
MRAIDIPMQVVVGLSFATPLRRRPTLVSSSGDKTSAHRFSSRSRAA